MSGTNLRTPAVANAEEAMGIPADLRIDVTSQLTRSAGEHVHLAIEWAGGVLWLDMSEQHDHFCVDTRQFVLAPDGTLVKGHSWNGGYVVTLVHDKVPSDEQTNRPVGPGRG